MVLLLISFAGCGVTRSESVVPDTASTNTTPPDSGGNIVFPLTPEDMDPRIVAAGELAVELHGETDGPVAVLLALERGFSAQQLVAGLELGILTTTGQMPGIEPELERAGVFALDEAEGDADTLEDEQSVVEDCDELNQVNLQLQWFAQAQFAGYYAAVDEGIYNDHCLDVTILEGGVDIVPQQQLASGAADFAISWVPKALVSREEGIDIVNVAQIFQRSGTLQVSFADSGIFGPADFAGRTIGSWGFGNEFELLAGSRQAGLEPGRDFEIVQQNFDMFALINGEIDAAQAMIYNEYAQILETENPETGELFTADDLTVIDWNEVGTAMLQDAIWADGEQLGDKTYQDITTRFIAASIEGWAWCRDNADACVDVVLANGPTLGGSHQEWQLNEISNLIWPSPDGAGVINQRLWDQTIQVATSESVLAREPDADSFTNEYVEDALKILADRGVDAIGGDFSKATVELNPGGE